MADSTEDLKREMEAFERGEESEDGSVAPAQFQVAEGSAARRVRKWVWWVILADFLLLIGVLLYFML